MNLKRWLQRSTRGVEDLALGAEEHSDPKYFVDFTIENSDFQKWVVFVASVGFLTDAYDIFALNIVNLIIPYVYLQRGDLPKDWQAGLLISTLAGTLVGQIVFGFFGDKYGRRKMYGYELVVLIVGSIGTAMASSGEADSMNILGWLTAWRIIMGVGIGADYPLSAVITSEFASREHRARMMASVFSMQPIGQVVVLAVALIVIKASQPHLETCLLSDVSQLDSDCIKTLDSAWRWVVGLGAVPALLAISFRLTIPQSPRFTIDNLNKADLAARETKAYYGAPKTPLNIHLAQITPLRERQERRESQDVPSRNDSAFELPPSAVNGLSTVPHNIINMNGARRISISSVTSARSSRSVLEVAQQSQVQDNELDTITCWSIFKEYLMWPTFKEYFGKDGNWKLLAGTASTWALLDIPFYGLGLSYTSVIGTIWRDSTNQCTLSGSLYDQILGSLWHDLVIVALGGLCGCAIFFKVIKRVSPRTLQLWGFVAITVLLLAMGIVFLAVPSGGWGPILLYVLLQIFFYLGPNPTTYLIPAELFPTQLRCTCHGLSAAAGRFGGIIAQLIITFAYAGSTVNTNSGTCNSNTQGLGVIFIVFSVFSALGAGLTWLLTPETRDKHGHPRSLKTLAKGYRHLYQLKGETDPEDKAMNNLQS